MYSVSEEKEDKRKRPADVICKTDMKKDGKTVRNRALSQDFDFTHYKTGRDYRTLGYFVSDTIFQNYRDACVKSGQKPPTLKSIPVRSFVSLKENPFQGSHQAFVIFFSNTKGLPAANLVLISSDLKDSIVKAIDREPAIGHRKETRFWPPPLSNADLTSEAHIKYANLVSQAEFVHDKIDSGKMVMRKDQSIMAVPVNIGLLLKQKAHPGNAGIIYDITATEFDEKSGDVARSITQDGRFVRISRTSRSTNKQERAYTLVPGHLAEFMSLRKDGTIVNGLKSENEVCLSFDLKVRFSTDFATSSRLQLSGATETQIRMVERALKTAKTAQETLGTIMVEDRGLRASNAPVIAPPPGTSKFSLEDTVRVSLILHVSGEVSDLRFQFHDRAGTARLGTGSSRQTMLNFNGKQYVFEPR